MDGPNLKNNTQFKKIKPKPTTRTVTHNPTTKKKTRKGKKTNQEELAWMCKGGLGQITSTTFLIASSHTSMPAHALKQKRMCKTLVFVIVPPQKLYPIPTIPQNEASASLKLSISVKKRVRTKMEERFHK